LSARHTLLAALALAASLAPAVRADAPAPNAAAAGATAQPPAKADLYTVIEHARQALLADQYDEAGKTLDAVLKMPEFAEADESVQFRVFLFAAVAARGREDFLGAHEFISIATKFPEATAEHWLLRARYASWIDAWSDAGTAILMTARNWPAELAKADPELVTQIADGMKRDGKYPAERRDLLKALFEAKFTLEWGLQPDDLWNDLILDALAHDDLRRAREINRRVESTATLLRMRIDRRYDALVTAERRTFNIAANAERERKRLAKLVPANPRSLDVQVKYGSALAQVGRFNDLLVLTNAVLGRIAAAADKTSPYDDISDELNWIYDLKARALRALGRWDEALAVMKAGRHEQEEGSDNVSQAINLGAIYLDYGRPQEALEALDGIDWAHSLSPYGRMQLQDVRYRAYRQLANASEADVVFAYLREHHEDAEDTWQYAMLVSGDVDGAAALLIARLRDPLKRGEALVDVQDYEPVPRLPKMQEEHDRWVALVARADVTAAINEVGRREMQPLHDVTW